MRHHTLLTLLSVALPWLALAADPAPAESDPEPKLAPQPVPVTRATAGSPPAHGPEDFPGLLPVEVPGGAHRPQKSTQPTDAISPDQPSVLEGF